MHITHTKQYAPVAQLDRALACGAKGRRFESCRVYHVNAPPCVGLLRGIRLASVLRLDSLLAKVVGSVMSLLPDPLKRMRRTDSCAFHPAGCTKK